MLEYTLKYNWWTAKADKKDISLEARITYVLQRGTIGEIKAMLRDIPRIQVRQIWKDIREDRGTRWKYLVDFLLE